MAKKTIKEVETPIVENISVEAMDNVMSDRYAVYAKYVIQDRAIPDARDGLKPVQRRIIYSMFKNGNLSDKPTKKCAKIVGDVMGRFHPHGDTSIYDALVRMSQSWKMSMPLVYLQGNNGSIDNDPPAAYRYTEAKLNEFSMNLVKDLDKNTVDMALNFDDTELEPTVLPSRYPNLYVNGSDGIAVAIATDIPPHNLIEMCDATIYRINHPKCTLDDLLMYVKGPDFPTGGLMYKTNGIRDIYETGRGKVDIVARTRIEELKDHNEIIINEIPYGVVKQALAYQIAKIIKAKEIDGMIDVKDLSAGDEIKIVVEVKKDANTKTILAYLMNKTQLKVSYTSNCMAICENHPRLMTLEYYLDTYIAHQVDVITRRSEFDLTKAKARLHIVEGLIKAINVIDQVVYTIRHSKDKADSKNNIIAKFGFTIEQAEAIVTMPLYKLSNADVEVYIKEKEELEGTIADLNDTLANPTKLKHIIINDLKEVSKKYGVPRRTEIIEDVPQIEINKRDLIVKEDCYFVVTKDGYVKRSPIKSYKASEGTLPGIKQGDTLLTSELTNTMDYALLFTNKGNYLCLSIDIIPEEKWKEEGKHLNTICSLSMSEKIIKCIIVKENCFNKKLYICSISKKGQIKRTALNEYFSEKTSRPVIGHKLLGDDEICDVNLTSGNSNLFIVTKKGNSTFFNENELAPLGLKANGVKAISTLKESEIGAMLTFEQEEKGKIVFITDKGCIRIYDIANSELTERLRRTSQVFKSFISSPHNLVYAFKVKSKEPIILHLLLKKNFIILDYELKDYYVTPLDSYCKKTIELDDTNEILDVYHLDTTIVDEKTKENVNIKDFKPANFFEEKKEEVNEETAPQTKVVAPKENAFSAFGLTKKKETRKEEEKKDDGDEDKHYEQISIFDDFGD